MLVYDPDCNMDGLLAVYDTEDDVTELHTLQTVVDCLNLGVRIKGLTRKKLASMKNKNESLISARVKKDDEFYTIYSDICEELDQYESSIFKDKVIYSPMDTCIDGVIPKSNFVKYFQENRDKLNFRMFIATSLGNDENYNKYVLERHLNSEGDVVWKESYSYCIKDDVYESGDFRSEYCIDIFNKADIVVTNPPFSLFREFYNILSDMNKTFIVLGNINILSNLKNFNDFRDYKLNIGYCGKVTSKHFIVRDNSIASKGREFKKVKLSNVVWFTSIKIDRDVVNDSLKTMSELNESGIIFRKYDNMDVLNVDKCSDIPSDYYELMGVPITAVTRLSRNEFDFITMCNSYSIKRVTEDMFNILKLDRNSKDASCLIDGRKIYTRVIIKRK